MRAQAAQLRPIAAACRRPLHRRHSQHLRSRRLKAQSAPEMAEVIRCRCRALMPHDGVHRRCYHDRPVESAGPPSSRAASPARKVGSRPACQARKTEVARFGAAPDAMVARLCAQRGASPASASLREVDVQDGVTDRVVAVPLVVVRPHFAMGTSSPLPDSTRGPLSIARPRKRNNSSPKNT